MLVVADDLLVDGIPRSGESWCVGLRIVTDIQFAASVWGIESLPEFRQFVLRADELGYDVLALPDHLGWLSPFAGLAAAAAISDRLRLRTYVLNYAFWNATNS